MKKIIFLGAIFFLTLAILDKTEAMTIETPLIVDPLLPRKKKNKVKRFFKKLNPFGRSSSKRTVYNSPKLQALLHSAAQARMNAVNARPSGQAYSTRSSYSGVYGPLPVLPPTVKNGYIIPPPPQGTSSSRIYDKVPPIYDKVPPIYDKVPPLGNNTYSKLPGLKEVFANGKAGTMQASSNSKMFPMHAAMNQQATQKAKTMGKNTMTAAKRGAFIKELQQAQKQKLAQKRKANRNLRIRQGRELVNYAQNPAKAKASGAGRGSLPKAQGALPPKPAKLPKQMIANNKKPVPPKSNAAKAPPKPPVAKGNPPPKPPTSKKSSPAVIKKKAQAKQKPKAAPKRTRRGRN